MNLIPSEEINDFSIAYQVADDFCRRVAHRVWELDKDPEKNPCGHRVGLPTSARLGFIRVYA